MPNRSPIAQRYRDVAGQDRRCVICSRHVTHLGELCEPHRRRRLRFGHPSLTRNNRMQKREWLSVLPAVRTYLNDHPPSADVLASAGRLILPGNAPPSSLSRQHARWTFYRELTWWQDKRSRKAERNATYSKLAILKRLVAASVIIEEQDRRWVGAGPEIQLALVLCSMFKPRHLGAKLGGGVRRLLAERIKESECAVFILMAARTILKDRAALEAVKAKTAKPTPPPPTLVTPPPLRNRITDLMKQHGITISHS